MQGTLHTAEFDSRTSFLEEQRSIEYHLSQTLAAKVSKKSLSLDKERELP